MKYQYRGGVKDMIKTRTLEKKMSYSKGYGGIKENKRKWEDGSSVTTRKIGPLNVTTTRGEKGKLQSVKASALKAVKGASKGALKGEERKLYKMTGKTGMRRSK